MLLGRGLAPLARILSQAPAKLSVGTWREMLREFALSASSASHSRESAGLPGESEAVARPRSCATRGDPRGRTWSGHPRLRCGDCVCLKTWMPGASPGKRLLGAKFGAKRSHELPFHPPRTALRDSDPRVKPRPDRRELSPGAEPAYSDAGRPLFSRGASLRPPRSRG